MLSTGHDLRSQVWNQITAVNGMIQQLNQADNTPSNNNLSYLASDALSALNDVFNNTDDDGNSIPIMIATQYKAANVKYKALTSTYGEFGTTSWPSFSDAIVESARELPTTLKDAGTSVGSAIGGIAGGAAGFTFATIKQTLKGFFGGFGWFGWAIVIIALIAAMFYFFPGLFAGLRGLIASKA